VIIDDTSVRAKFASGGHLKRCDILPKKEFKRAAVKLSGSAQMESWSGGSNSRPQPCKIVLQIIQAFDQEDKRAA
jgi:hypothetical protein